MMNLKVNTILFFVLLIAFLFGDKSFHVAYHADYFVFKMNQLIIFILTIVTGLGLINKFIKYIKSRNI